MDNFRMAYAIQCHKNPEQLNNLVDKISDKDVDIFIHVDKKSSIINFIEKKDNIYFTDKRFKVKWGHSSQFFATVELLKKIHKTGSYDYIHFISGQDYPIKCRDEIKSFFKENYGKQFIQYRPLPNDWPYNGMSRVLVHYPHFLFANEFTRKIMYKYEKLVMKITAFQRNIESLPQLYGGSCWFSITGDCMKYILEFLHKNPDYIKFFQNTHCGDEIFFQTILVNSKYRQHLFNDNMRYIDWSNGGASPKVLLEEDFQKLQNSHKLYARKLDYNMDSNLFEKLNEIV
ncbi:glycosyl transferase family protein [Clostridium pasteurianum DSM 525 = ATCC 6013]|uniref:Peptide O-xylosyltransferase n=1 Tax=Clostridium pasteurianum DSM 525 = ATCC 6013 TaxID=1262449 RepID=A0A0H3IZ20_CLOPA|nr:beta-1,6-N-acetylglucosaminyltransferase [Clostridium pasteurianum]AJA46771.1 glycosyl transferase family protein [Clostridium pasteurianum DSM 525 = ATCC 6013]AJA50759.1 glycosyl transferase family protein [Clostridium pasteurianum DSM 525 = ATCC 6013]AOZ74164.1 hypothetical protein AQ983_03220 [Clostridium pasteurianum DSM 525 = ATCC 6013]AOZ77962.1 hypothetical protein AQ984_03220 [Clostridium pasteurianum]ELP58619.1 glycosyl transferase family protein [Clostridium pasteurianum DSM 525 =